MNLEAGSSGADEPLLEAEEDGKWSENTDPKVNVPTAKVARVSDAILHELASCNRIALLHIIVEQADHG